MGTKSDILGLLQRDALTVTQLCERVGITRNAVTVQLRQLEAEGLVRRARRLERGGVGKPASLFEAAPGSEDVASGAYQILLPALLTTLRDRLDPDALAEVLEQTGRRLAHEAGLSGPADAGTGLRAAMAAADALGASTEAVPQPGGIMVRNYSCPIGGAVRADPCACRVMAAFFSEATGRPATEHCLRDGRLVCQYLIEDGPKA
ncbi:helix-turn-helix transcriptional regulator [Inquilinus sp.]|uniref:helix-turn-helix transcriptional regulator n=1 Tax=Inquilinus sp. TaxID=1932117 RepID=UPI003783C614